MRREPLGRGCDVDDARRGEDAGAWRRSGLGLEEDESHGRPPARVLSGRSVPSAFREEIHVAQVELLPVNEVTPEFERIIPPGTTMERIPVDNSFAEGPVWNAR